MSARRSASWDCKRIVSSPAHSPPRILSPSAVVSNRHILCDNRYCSHTFYDTL